MNIISPFCQPPSIRICRDVPGDEHCQNLRHDTLMILETQLLLCFCKAAATALFATRHRTWQEVLVTNLQVLARKLSMYLLTSPLPPRTSNVVATGHTIKTQGPPIFGISHEWMSQMCQVTTDLVCSLAVATRQCIKVFSKVTTARSCAVMSLLCHQ